MKRKPKPTRSLKQQWQAERKWELYGRLTGVVATLNEAAKKSSIIPFEELYLHIVADTVYSVVRSIQDNLRDEESFALFKARKGKIYLKK